MILSLWHIFQCSVGNLATQSSINVDAFILSGIHASSTRHPKTVVAHLVFKALAVLAYLFSSFYTSSFIIVFITVITWLSIDFWSATRPTLKYFDI